MSELTVTLLRFAFLVLLWVLVLAVVASQGRDMRLDGRLRSVSAGSPARHETPPERQPERAGATAATATPEGTRRRPQQLVMLEGPQAGSTFPLGEASVLLGRSAEATVALEDDYASGRHARLFPQGSRWFLEDLGSTNGTFLHDQKLTRAAAIDPGARFRIGKTVMELRP